MLPTRCFQGMIPQGTGVRHHSRVDDRGEAVTCYVPTRIHITGASGSGTTTLGQALSQKAHLVHFETDDYFWEPSDPPYVHPRPREVRLRLLSSSLDPFEGMKMKPITRKAESGDIPEIQRLYRQGDSHHADLLPEVFQPVEGDVRGNDFVQKLIDWDDADYLVAELDGQVIGFVNVQRASHPKYPMFRPHEFALIEDAVVDEPYRGKGVGTILFRAAIDWARDHGLRYVQTTVWHANVGAREFYLNQGFRPMTMKLELDSEEGQ